jgi:hypothetical protein
MMLKQWFLRMFGCFWLKNKSKGYVGHRTVDAEAFVSMLALHIKDEDITDEQFRKWVNTQLTIVRFKGAEEEDDG